MKLSNTLKNLRNNKKISLRTAAKGIGITHSTLLRLERGDYNPNLTTLMNICRYYDVTVADVIKR